MAFAAIPLIAGAVGYAGYEAYEHSQNSIRGAVLPGHKYIGPGNSLNRGTPVDQDDRIAYHHDQLYAATPAERDVYHIDEASALQFDKDWQENGNIHSFIGKLGLSTKTNIERYTGILYPKTGTWWQTTYSSS